LFFKNYRKEIVWLLLLFMVFSIILPLRPQPVKAAVDVQYSLHNTAYDIWKNTAGEWVQGSGSITRPNQPGTHIFNSNVPGALSDYTLVDVINIDAGYVDDPRVISAYNPNVRDNLQGLSRWIAVNNTVTNFSASGTNVYITANITTLPNEQGRDISQEWQGEQVEGERTYFFYLSKWEKDVELETGVIADFDLNPKAYEYQDVGYADRATSINSPIEYRKLTISGDNGYYNEIENNTSPLIRLREGNYAFELFVRNDAGDTDTKTKNIEIIKEGAVDSEPIAVINAPDTAAINETFTVSAKGSIASAGAKIVNYKWYLGSSINNLTHNSSFDGLEEISASYPSEGDRFFRVEITDTASKQAVSNVAVTEVTDNTPVGLFADLEIPNTVWEGVPFKVSTDESYIEYGDDILTLKEAREMGLVRHSYDFSTNYTGDLDYSGGEIYVEELGMQSGTFTLRSRGEKDLDTEAFEVLQTPDTFFTISGVRKENRRLVLSTHATKAHIDYPINQSKTVIKIQNTTTSELKTLTSTQGSSAGNIRAKRLIDKRVEFTIKQPGIYSVEVYQEDTRGKSSTKSETLTILEDKPPKADFIVPEVNYRDSSTGNAKINITKKHSSPDGDIIEVKNLRYRYDTKNDGRLDNESWIALPEDQDEHEINLANRVGQVEIDYYVEETFDHIPDHVIGSDFLSNRQTKVVEIANIAPVTSFNLIKREKVDAVFYTGENDIQGATTQSIALRERLNNREDIIVDFLAEAKEANMGKAGVEWINKSSITNKELWVDGNIEITEFSTDEYMVIRVTQSRGIPADPEALGYWAVSWEDLVPLFKISQEIEGLPIGYNNNANYISVLEYEKNGLPETMFILQEGYNRFHIVDFINSRIIKSFETEFNIDFNNDLKLNSDGTAFEIVKDNTYNQINIKTGNTTSLEFQGEYITQKDGWVYSYVTEGFYYNYRDYSDPWYVSNAKITLSILKTRISDSKEELVRKKTFLGEEVLTSEQQQHQEDLVEESWAAFADSFSGDISLDITAFEDKIIVVYTPYISKLLTYRDNRERDETFRAARTRVLTLNYAGNVANDYQLREWDSYSSRSYTHYVEKMASIGGKVLHMRVRIRNNYNGNIIERQGFIINEDGSSFGVHYDVDSYAFGEIDGILQGSVYYGDTGNTNDRYWAEYIGAKFPSGESFSYYLRGSSSKRPLRLNTIPFKSNNEKYVGLVRTDRISATIYDLVTHDSMEIELNHEMQQRSGRIIPINDDMFYVFGQKGSAEVNFATKEYISPGAGDTPWIGEDGDSPSVADFPVYSPGGKYWGFRYSDWYTDKGLLSTYKPNIGFYHDIKNKLVTTIFRSETLNNYIVTITKEPIILYQYQIDELSNLANNRNAKFIFMGSEANRIAGESLANATGGIFMTYSTINNAFNSVENFISGELEDIGNELTIYAKKGENIVYNKFYSDLEGDSHLISGSKPWERWRYNHVVYPEGRIAQHNTSNNIATWLSKPLETINRNGEFLVDFVRMDNPPPSTSSYVDYRKVSKTTPVRIIVTGEENIPETTIEPTVEVDISGVTSTNGDFLINNRVDFNITIIEGTHKINPSSLNISLNTNKFRPTVNEHALPVISSTNDSGVYNLKFSRLFTHEESPRLTVSVEDANGNEYTKQSQIFSIKDYAGPTAKFSLEQIRETNENRMTTFRLIDNSTKGFHDIGDRKHLQVIEETDALLYANEDGELEIFGYGEFIFKQKVTDSYSIGMGLNGEYLDDYRVFKEDTELIVLNIPKPMPEIEYAVLPNIILVGETIGHNINIIEGEYAEYSFVHHYNYYQNGHGIYSGYNHPVDPNNPTGAELEANKSLVPLSELTKKGQYDFYVRAVDFEGDTSDWVYGGTVYASSEPVSDFTLASSAQVDTDNGEYIFIDGRPITVNNLSYNEDYEDTITNHGISNYKLEYKNVTDSDNEWNIIKDFQDTVQWVSSSNLPVISENGVYEVRQTIGSPEGFFHSTTKEFVVLDFRLEAELDPGEIHSGQEYTIKATVSKDANGVVAKNHLEEWVTLTKTGEDADNFYYEIKITTLETLPDGIYPIEVYGMYPYGLELKEVLELTVDTPLELSSNIVGVGNQEYIDNNLSGSQQDSRYIKVPSSEKIEIAAEVTSPIPISEVTAKLEGDTEIILTYDSETELYVGEMQVSKSDKDYYELNITATIVNGSTATHIHKVMVNTPIDLTPKIVDKTSNIVLTMDSDFNVSTSNSPYAQSVSVRFPFEVKNTAQSITYPANTWILLNGSIGDVEYNNSFYLPSVKNDGTVNVIENQTHIVQFRAYAINHTPSNPNMEIRQLTVTTIGMKVEDLRMIFTGDISWYDYYFDSNNNFKDGTNIYINTMPVNNIKAGYNVYYMLKSKGLENPDDIVEYVDVDISYNNAISDLKPMHQYKRFININTLSKAREYQLEGEFNSLDSNEQLWVLEYTTPINAPSGTRVYFNITAYKDSAAYNLNENTTSSDWGGNIGNVLLLQGNIREDIGSSVSH